MLAGLIGVPLGSYLAQTWRRTNESCDPLICAIGLITSAPLVYLGLVVSQHSLNWGFFFVFFAEVSLNMSWSIVADILLVSVILADVIGKGGDYFYNFLLKIIVTKTTQILDATGLCSPINH